MNKERVRALFYVPLIWRTEIDLLAAVLSSLKANRDSIRTVFFLRIIFRTFVKT